MQPHDAVHTLLAQQVGHVGLVVLEEVFGEGGCAFRVDEDVEVGFLVGVAVGMVCAEGSLLTVVEAVLLVCFKLVGVVGQGDAGGLVEAGGQAVAFGLSLAGIYAPAACCAPLPARTCGINVYAQVEAVVLAIMVAQAVDDAAALAQFFRLRALNEVVGQVDKDGEARCFQLFLDAEAYLAAKLIFVKLLVGATVAAHVLAMGCAQDDDSSVHFYMGSFLFENKERACTMGAPPPEGWLSEVGAAGKDAA